MNPRRQKRDAAMKHGYSGIGPGIAHANAGTGRNPHPCSSQVAQGLVFTFGVHVDLEVPMLQCFYAQAFGHVM